MKPNEEPPLVELQRVGADFFAAGETIDVEEVTEQAAKAAARAFFDVPQTEDERMAEFGIDAFCDLVIEMKPLEKIAEHVGVRLACLMRWLNANPERYSRWRLAMTMSAAVAEERADRILAEAKGTAPEIARAKEIAQHLRWRAALRDRKNYGDQKTIDHNHTVNMTQEQRLSKMEALRAKALQLAGGSE